MILSCGGLSHFFGKTQDLLPAFSLSAVLFDPGADVDGIRPDDSYRIRCVLRCQTARIFILPFSSIPSRADQSNVLPLPGIPASNRIPITESDFSIPSSDS